MAYEPDKKQVLVFGGLNSDSGSLLNDLWAYDRAANTWTKLNPRGGSPRPRVDGMASMAY